MNLIDFHCDTVSKIFDSREEISLKENDLHIDLHKLKKANSLAQFFALYIDLAAEPTAEEDKLEESLAMLDKFYQLLETNKEEIAIARDYKELKLNQEQGKISAFLSIEEGGVLQESLANLRNFYRLGVRAITLTWNYPNQLGYPNSKLEYREQGLTNFGKQVVREMNRLGMLVDVSHLSDQGFWDVAHLSEESFIASHSNARAVRDHSRNLTDDMIKIIANQGGIIGVNFVTDFLGGSKVSKVEDIVRHIKHIKQVGGSDVIALGSDFDGTDSQIEISNISEIDKLIHALEKNGFSGVEIEKILFKNGERVIKEVIG
ncbi:dipeptidase [Halanaerocella petrolearia]